MSETEAIEPGTAAKPPTTSNVVAVRSHVVVPLFAECGRSPGSLAAPQSAAGEPPDGGENPHVSGSVTTDAREPEHGSSPESASFGGIGMPTTERATWHHLVGDDGVVVIDDCTLFREILAAILAVKGVAVAGTAWDLASLVAAFEGTEANLMLLNMATRDSHLLIRAAKDISLGVRIIVVGIPEEDEQNIIACAEAGVAGYHMRHDSLDDLIDIDRQRRWRAIHLSTMGVGYFAPPTVEPGVSAATSGTGFSSYDARDPDPQDVGTRPVQQGNRSAAQHRSAYGEKPCPQPVYKARCEYTR